MRLPTDVYRALEVARAERVPAVLATVVRAVGSAPQDEGAKLILTMGAPGILEDRHNPSSLVSYLDLEDLQALRANGSLAEGMLPKARAIEAAIKGGVPRVHLISYKIPDSLLLEIFTNEGTGTLVVEDTDTLTPEEQEAGA